MFGKIIPNHVSYQWLQITLGLIAVSVLHCQSQQTLFRSVGLVSYFHSFVIKELTKDPSFHNTKTDNGLRTLFYVVVSLLRRLLIEMKSSESVWNSTPNPLWLLSLSFTPFSSGIIDHSTCWFSSHSAVLILLSRSCCDSIRVQSQ